MRTAVAAALVLQLAACGGRAVQPEADAAGVPAVYDQAALNKYEAAIRLAGSGDVAGAETGFRELVDAYPAYAGPMVNLALIQARRQELEPAAALLQQAVAVCTNCAVPWNELGLVQRQQGKFQDAEKSYLNAIAADAGYANAHFNLAVLYELYMQRPELALDQYQSFRTLVLASADTGDVDKWIADLQRRTAAVERSAQLEAGP